MYEYLVSRFQKIVNIRSEIRAFSSNIDVTAPPKSRETNTLQVSESQSGVFHGPLDKSFI